MDMDATNIIKNLQTRRPELYQHLIATAGVTWAWANGLEDLETALVECLADKAKEYEISSHALVAVAASGGLALTYSTASDVCS